DFDLWTQINRKNISPAKQLMATNEIQGCRRNYWNKTCRSPPGNMAKKSRGGRNRDRTRTRQHRTEFRRFECLAYPPAECTPNVYPILWDRQRIRPPRRVFHFRFCQAARQVAVGPTQREIKSVLDLFAQFVTDVSEKDFQILAAVFAKAVAQSKAD